MSVLIENMEMPKDCLHCCFKNMGTGYELTLCDLAGWVKMKDGCRADECPLAETQPESQWIPSICHSDGMHHEWCGFHCSICKEATVIRHNYCPRCGAKMERGEE